MGNLDEHLWGFDERRQLLMLMTLRVPVTMSRIVSLGGDNDPVRAFKMGRELAQRKRQHPEPWRLGETLAEDRFEMLPGEDRVWSLATVDDYLREVAEDAVKLVDAVTRRRGSVLDTEASSTVGIACGYTLEPVLREYISSGAAWGDTAAIAEYRDDYDRGRDMADKGFFPDPEPWLATAPLIASGIELHIDDTGLAVAFAMNAFTPQFQQVGVAKGGYFSRMAELIRHYTRPENAVDLRERSEVAAARRAEYKRVHTEVEAEFRAKGNYSGAEMAAETERRLANLEGLPPPPS